MRPINALPKLFRGKSLVLVNVLEFPIEVGDHDARIVGVDGRVHAGFE